MKNEKEQPSLIEDKKTIGSPPPFCVDEPTLSPGEIEKESFRILSQQLGAVTFPEPESSIIKRVIHTTADFSYARTLYFSPGAIDQALVALRNGCTIVTDTQMALAGINKKNLGRLGCKGLCFMGDPEVGKLALSQNRTRAAVSMEKACALAGPLLFAIGNAPTALFQLQDAILQKKVSPILVIAAPVGFVNVIEAKEKILTGATPCIVAKGNKGGSPVAAAIVNALMLLV